MPEDLFLIWSLEHTAWWAPDECGYTRVLAAAGRYRHGDALRIVERANLVLVHECAIPVACVASTEGRLRALVAFAEQEVADWSERNADRYWEAMRFKGAIEDALLAAPVGSRPAITCPRCGRTSYHPKDVTERYCGACHLFHDQMAEHTHEE